VSQPNAAFEPDAQRLNAERLTGDFPQGDQPGANGQGPHPAEAYASYTGFLGADISGPWYPAEPPKPRRRPGLTAAQAIGVFVAVSVLGWPLGVLWQAVAPNVPVLVVSDGAVYNDPQPEQFMGGDGWFAVLGLAFGIVLAVVTWITCKQLRGPIGLLVLAVAGTVAAIVAWRVGRQIGVSDYLSGLHSAPEGTHLSKPNDLRIQELRLWPPRLGGVLLIPALGATLTMTIMAAWSSFASLRNDPAAHAPEPSGSVAEESGTMAEPFQGEADRSARPAQPDAAPEVEADNPPRSGPDDAS
jgi:hypothetical protein